MKKLILIITIILSIAVGIFIYNTPKAMKTQDELIEKITELQPHIERDMIKSVHILENQHSALVWFIGDDSNKIYLAMECSVVGKNEYVFHDTKPVYKSAEDIVKTIWAGEVTYLINNDDCVVIDINVDGDTIIVPIENNDLPYMLDLVKIEELVEREFQQYSMSFLDENGIEIL